MTTRQPVRWWVVIGAILVAWLLTCFGPTAEAHAQTEQTVASDSATLRKLAEYRASENFEQAVCIAAHRESPTVVVIDSIVAMVAGPPCPPGSGGLAGNAPSDIPPDVAVRIGEMLLVEYPDFLIACAIVGTTTRTFEDGNALFVPILTCAVRIPS